VVGLAREPLISQVAAGRFSPQLYYRLNIVMIEMRSAADLP
jgi:DNA-binding NtrC family response regulator